MLNSEAVVEPTSASRGRIAPFGKYLLLQRVSVGGMAEVFKALPEDARRIDQIVAIKRILPSIAADSEFIGMFIDEARVAGQLNHPNICKMYELGRVGSDHYIAMQFLWGRDLLKVMNRHKKAGRFVSPSLSAFVGAKALCALHYAHTKRDGRGRPLHIIHRDVSPQNIIVGYSGQVKLIDFGVARAATQSQKTQAGILKGKFGYMSPEMVRGLPIDHRSDVFAMGICLHELLTNARLFYGETDFATLELVRDAKVPAPSLKSPGVPAALDAIVMKALAREAEDRFQTAEEMQLALEEFLRQHDPHFTQDDVGAAIRHAFNAEVVRERERLDVFWKMLERGELVRGASVPLTPSEAAAAAGQTPAQGSAPASGEQTPQLAADELHEEQTHIFFSADELDEITELRSDHVHSVGPATLSDMIPPAVPERASQPYFLPPSGTYERAPSIIPARPSHRAHGDEPRASTLPPPPVPAASSSHAGRTPWLRMNEDEESSVRRPAPYSRWAVMALLLVTLGMATYAVPRFATAGTGALSIESVDDPNALVRVDGVVRGNPPLMVEELTPGVHRLEIEAAGYELARADVHVEQGQARSVKLVLEKLPFQLEGTGGKDAPRTTPLAPPTGKVVVQRHRATHPGAGGAGDEGEATVEPSVDDRGAEEHAVDQEVSEELAGTNQGELLISTVPWARVFVDGIDTERETPVRALRVAAGAHRVGLRTPDEVMHEFDVVVKPGQTLRIIRRF